MAGGLIQLVAYGSQDLYLTGNPEITFFKTSYRRYTNFSMETNDQVLSGNTDFGNKAYLKIPRKADLINNLWLKSTITDNNDLSDFVKLYNSKTHFEYLNILDENVFNIIDTENLTINVVENGIIQLINKNNNSTGDSPPTINDLNLIDSLSASINFSIDITPINPVSRDINLIPPVPVGLNYNNGIISGSINTPGIYFLKIQVIDYSDIGKTQEIGRSEKVFRLIIDENSDKIKTKSFSEESFNESYGIINISETINFNGTFIIKKINNNSILLFADENTYTTSLPSETSFNFVVKTYNYFEIYKWNIDIGYSLIDSVELLIGGTRIDKHYGKWMHIWSQLTRTSDHDSFHNKLINPNISNSVNLYIPLQFYFCRNNGLSLPIIALQYHEVQLEFVFSKKYKIANNFIINNGIVTIGNKFNNLKMSNTTLLINYIYLDDKERKLFAQASHEYLFEQIQLIESRIYANLHNNIHLDMNHPIKELVWVIEKSKFMNFNFTNSLQQSSGSSPINESCLLLNGYERFSKQKSKYFNYLQPYVHHSRTPNTGIHVYSFCLNPEIHQPTGTCNFSRLDFPKLTLDTKSNSGDQICVYALNYNVLRITSGMAGVAYNS